MTTYPEMNSKIAELLRNSGQPMQVYAAERIEELEAAIRNHRDQRGDDRCWLDDEGLYLVLSEGYEPPARDTTVELDNCKRFIACRQNPATEYVSPQREISDLKALVIDLMEYSRHMEGCSGPFGYPCKCLFSEVVRRAQEACK